MPCVFTIKSGRQQLLSAACAAIIVTGPAIAATENKHLGVASCASSNCHGSARPNTGTSILQNEYFTWQRKDRHARAFETLRNEKSLRIAAKLGMANAAAAPECLSCHADAVPAAQRAKGHQLSDGVGCEVCHGGAERWLAPHTAGYKSDADRRNAGLVPLWEAPVRARVCLSCHQGDAQRPMHHRLMGAGHPPLRFELDTYMSVMPPHHTIDADYVQRKGVQDGARNWLSGQAAAAELQLEHLAALPGQGSLFPELALFDCNACHHSLTVLRWEPGLAGTLAPGSLRIADVPLRMLGIWLDVADPDLARRWRESLTALQRSVHEKQPALQQRAQALRELLKGFVVPRLAIDKLESKPLEMLLRGLLREHRAGPAGADFSSAEQLVMASTVLFTVLSERGSVKLTPAFKTALDSMYAAVADRDRFQPADFRRAVTAAEAALIKAR